MRGTALIQPVSSATPAGLKAPVGLSAPAGLNMHIQGVALLLFLLVAFWFVVGWGGRVISRSFDSENGVIVMVSRSEDGLSSTLSNVEVMELQGALVDAGYNPGPVDGFLGILTRTAINKAKAELGFEGISDRELVPALIEISQARYSSVT